MTEMTDQSPRPGLLETTENAAPAEKTVETESGERRTENGKDRAELLRRAVFAEEALELSRWIKDKSLLQRLRNTITGETEMELKQKLAVLKDVLAHIKEVEDEGQASQQEIRQMVAEEVEQNIDRLKNAVETVDAAIGRAHRGAAGRGDSSSASRLRRLAEARGILIK